MYLSIREIDTGNIVDNSNGLSSIKKLDDSSSILEIKKAASKLFNSTSENIDFLYWVAEIDGVAIQKGTAFDLNNLGFGE